MNRTQDTPPSYDDVVKTEEEAGAEDGMEEDPTQPPSYVEAMVQRRTSEVSLTPIDIEDGSVVVSVSPSPKLSSASSEAAAAQQSHVVQIEVPGVHHSHNNQSQSSSSSNSLQRSHSLTESLSSVDGAKAAPVRFEMK